MSQRWSLRVVVIPMLAAGLTMAGCSKPKPLTEKMAEVIVRENVYAKEPVYAEVPQKVWYGPKSPRDDYDDKAVATLKKLEAAGFVTVAESHTPDGMTTFQAKVTENGFRILGTMPSARGPVYRARICEKLHDGIRNFVRHPTDPHVGSAELVWHYDNPTAMYQYFDTKMNKPLKTPFVSVASFYFDKGAWRVEVTVKKANA
jgi:hypothetical protein